MHEHEERFHEGDPGAWDRAWSGRPRDEDLFHPERRDMYNFIDETKVRYLRPFLPPGGRAIEIGAGSGRLLIRCGLERPYQLVALDYAVTALRTVRENFGRAGLPGELVLADARGLPFPDASFDLVLSGGVLEHFREDDATAVVAEQVRLLKPGGLFYADVVPRKVSLVLWADRDGIRKHAHYTDPAIYWSDYGKSTWMRILQRAGLRHVRVFSCGVMPPLSLRRHAEITWRLAPFLRALDGTPLADWIGYYYFCMGRRS